MTLTSERNVGLGRFQTEKQDQILNYQNDILYVAKLKGEVDEQTETITT